MKSRIILVLATVALLSGCKVSASNVTDDESNQFGWFSSKRVKASDVIVSKEIFPDEFNKLTVSGSFNVSVTQKTGKPKIEITTSDNIINLIETTVRNGELNIKFKKGYSVSYKKMVIHVYANSLNGISIAGSGNIDLKNGMETGNLNVDIAGSGNFTGNKLICGGDLKLSISGSGNIQTSVLVCKNIKLSVAGSGNLSALQVRADNVRASIAGSGDLKLSGEAYQSNLDIAGSGSIESKELRTRSTTASIAGSGDITCYPTEYLKASSAGSGTVGYKGSPKQLDIPKNKIHKID